MTDDIPGEAEMPHGIRPPTLRQASVLKNSAGPFDHSPNSALRNTIGVRSARSGYRVAPPNLGGSPRDLGGAIGVEHSHWLLPSKVLEAIKCGQAGLVVTGIRTQPPGASVEDNEGGTLAVAAPVTRTNDGMVSGD
jgi:hypothetical protein